MTARIYAVRRALLSVDAINGFISAELGGELPVPGGELIGPVVGELQLKGPYVKRLKAFDSHPRDMFNFASVNPHKKPYVDRCRDRYRGWTTVYPDHCVGGTWGCEDIAGIHSDLFDERFPKGTDRDLDSYSACGNPQLVPYLRQHAIGHVDVVGLVRRICVANTAVELAMEGFKVRIVEDGTMDLDVPGFEWALNEFGYLGIESVTSAQVFAEADASPRRRRRS